MPKQRDSSLFIEQKGIEFVPLTERYGRSSRLFSIWFSVNMSIVCLTVGTIGIVAGLGFRWTIAALLLGNIVGTLFMAAHSAQGPHLGVPQMIQSRAQFGVVGAAIPLLAVVLTYTLYMSADAIVVKSSIASLASVGDKTAIVVFGGLTLIVAFFGYELIHKLGILLTVVSGGLIAAAAGLLIMRHSHSAVRAPDHFDLAIFLATMTQAAAWSLTFGPYVADYSRYLPASVSTEETFWFTAFGNVLGTSLAMSLGAYMAAFFPRMSTDPGIGIASLFGGGWVIKLLIALGVFQGNVLNLYSAYMSSTTVLTAFNTWKASTVVTKMIIITIVTTIATVIAIACMQTFDRTFGDMLSVMAYMLIPWSAINLSDYYIVKNGNYDVVALFNRASKYGSFSGIGIGVYFAAIAFEYPFMRLTHFSGPIADRIGVDIAWVPGLLVPAVLYSVLEKRRLARSNFTTSKTTQEANR